MNWGRQVARVATPVDVDTMRAALDVAAPLWTPLQKLWALCLIWVETGRGRSLIQYNVGNLASGGFSGGVDVPWWSGSYWRPAWYDNSGSPLHAKMLAGQAPSAFRAYDDLTAGVRAFVELLSKPKYSPVLAAAAADSPEQFVTQLNACGYSKDYTSAHVPTFRSLRTELGGSVPVPLACPRCGRR